jgi:hypothetical protein
MPYAPFITGHKTFDRQSEEAFFTGNAITNTQLSWFVRPVQETECNGFTFPKGKLFEEDIKSFGPNMDPSVVTFVRNLNRKVVVYQLRHWARSGCHKHKIVDGYIVANPNGKVVQVFKRSRHPKSLDIIDAAITRLESGRQSQKQQERGKSTR